MVGVVARLEEATLQLVVQNQLQWDLLTKAVISAFISSTLGGGKRLGASARRNPESMTFWHSGIKRASGWRISGS